MAVGTPQRSVMTAITTKKKASPMSAVYAAPIWKSYLAARTENSGRHSTSVLSKAELLNNGMLGQRSRKRPKPTAANDGSGGGHRRSMSADGGSTTILYRIRQYWEQLSAQERQQILFIDEPDLVKQLYKLNLSLLCVGLMQRHLKTTSTIRTASSTTALNAKAKTASMVPPAQPSSVLGASTDGSTGVKAAATSIDPTEKTYELLEAMEFMDIGTGILTVKSELVDEPWRLFSLVSDVLFNFLTSVHLLSEKQFHELFVTESEVINTWEDYQRLIAMLVEQLILRSYVAHLEKEAAIQMEQLLLEESFVDAVKSDTNVKKKTKKKNKKKTTQHSSKPSPSISTEATHDSVENNENDCRKANQSNVTPVPSNGSTIDKEESIESNKNQLTVEKANVMRSSGLNPNASVFQPHGIIHDEAYLRSPFMGKRKLDEYIIDVHWQDLIRDDEDGYDSFDGYTSDDDSVSGQESTRTRWNQPQHQARSQQRDDELEWQLEQVYSATSSMFGWDFSRQCELPTHPMLPWNDSIFWKTAPKEVVRYFSPALENSYTHFAPPGFLPPSSLPQSRFYFAPPHPVPLPLPFPQVQGPAQHVQLLPSPPPHHHMYDFQGAPRHEIVSSPDFFTPAEQQQADH